MPPIRSLQVSPAGPHAGTVGTPYTLTLAPLMTNGRADDRTPLEVEVTGASASEAKHRAVAVERTTAGTVTVVLTIGGAQETHTVRFTRAAAPPQTPPVVTPPAPPPVPPAPTPPAPAPPAPPTPATPKPPDVVTAPQQTPAPAPAGALAIACRVHRFDGGSGSVLLSNGIPLPPGALRPGDEARVALTIGGAATPCHVAALAGRHPDGSVRAVLVQATATLGATETPAARVTIGTAARPAAQQIPAVPPVELPAAALLPTEPAYLCSTGLVGRQVPVAAVRALGGAFATYEDGFAQWAETHWAKDGDQWLSQFGGNYYDRAFVWFTWWARTGEVRYFERGLRQIAGYKRDHLHPTKWQLQPHQAQMLGLAAHYHLTGSPDSRAGLGNWAENAYGYIQNGMTTAPGGPGNWDMRIVARAIEAQLAAARVDARAVWAADKQPADYAARVNKAVADLARWQRPNGSFNFGVYWNSTQTNWMMGMVADALIVADEDGLLAGATRATAIDVATRMAAYIHPAQWDAAAEGGVGALRYGDGPCWGEQKDAAGVVTRPAIVPGAGADNGTNPASDLTLMVVSLWGWLASVTGNAGHRTAGDVIFAAGARTRHLSGSKQFNEAHRYSPRYLAYRPA